jgi:putative transposase
MDSLSAKQIAELKQVSVQYVHKRATKEGWPFEESTCRGGSQKRYPLSGLPDDIQILYNKVQLVEAGKAMVPAPRTSYPPAPSRPIVLCQGQQEKALAKYDLLRLYKERVNSAAYGQKVAVRDSFMETYNAGLLYPKLFEQLGELSWKTIEGWKLDVKSAGNDCFVLADQRGAWRRGATSINETHAKILLACLLHPNKPQISEAIRYARELMHKRGISNGFSDATYRRWIKEWRERNYHIWTFTRDGWKAWNDHCALSGERDFERIEVGDVVVADGHVLNFDIINPWTGKPKRMVLILWLDMKSSFPLGWEIMPTENTQAIAAALRWAILRLGKIPKIPYLDNGKAFGARFFEGKDLEQEAFSGLFERLGMQVIHARPYRGQSKTVERFFGTFSELERWAPTFTGTCIADKPPGMMRGERLHRKVRAQMVGGGISLEQAHLAVADWFDRYARRPQQEGHLKGRTPLEVFEAGRGPGVDRALLDDMMMACEIKSIRRSAIQFNGRQYYHRELHGRSHKVLIHYDFQDTSYIRVSELSGESICVAHEYEKLHPAARHLGSDTDRLRLAEHSEEHRHQEKEASSFAKEFLANEFLPHHRQQMAQVGITPLPRIDAGAKTPNTRQIPEKTTISDEQWVEIQAQAAATEVECPAGADCSVLDVTVPEVEEDAVAMRARLEALPEDERYMAIMEMEVRGRMIPERWRDFARYFEDTLAYLNNKDHFEQMRGMLAVQWQAQANAQGGR